MVYIKFGIVFELFVYKIHGDSDGAFLCGTEILNSKLKEMDFNLVLDTYFIIYRRFISGKISKDFIWSGVSSYSIFIIDDFPITETNAFFFRFFF